MVASEEYIATLEDFQVSSLTDTQEKILSIIPLFTATLSIFGSIVIIKLIYFAKRKSPYRRILLGLSCCDIIASIGWAIQPYIVPKDTSQWIWAIGNDFTCAIGGAITQFSFSSQWYSGFLSIYFLWTVRYSMKPEQIEIYEPYFHVFIILYSLSTAIAGVIMGIYNPMMVGPGCWVRDYPTGCGYAPDYVTCKSTIIAYIFGGIPTILIFVSIMVNNSLIYCFVRSTILRSVRNSSVRGFTIENTGGGDGGIGGISGIRAIGAFGSSTGGGSGSSLANNLPRRFSSSAPRLMSSQLKRVKEVGRQSFLYVGVYFCSYVVSYYLRVMESISYTSSTQGDIFHLLVLQAILAPGQGIFNALIFIRPQYLRIRQDFPYEPRWWCIQRILYGDNFRLSTKSNIQLSANSATSGLDATNNASNHGRSSRYNNNITFTNSRDSIHSTTCNDPIPSASSRPNDPMNNNYDNSSRRPQSTSHLSLMEDDAFSDSGNSFGEDSGDDIGIDDGDGGDGDGDDNDEAGQAGNQHPSHRDIDDGEQSGGGYSSSRRASSSSMSRIDMAGSIVAAMEDAEQEDNNNDDDDDDEMAISSTTPPGGSGSHNNNNHNNAICGSGGRNILQMMEEADELMMMESDDDN